MFNLMTGGNFKNKGYYYRIFLTFPEFNRSTTISINRRQNKTTKISFPTKFMLISNNNYCNIVIRLFGFGIGLEIQSKN